MDMYRMTIYIMHPLKLYGKTSLNSQLDCRGATTTRIYESCREKSNSSTDRQINLVTPLNSNQSITHSISQSINWGLRPKGEGRSGSKGLSYREKNFLIFVGLMLKCYSTVPFHWSGTYLICVVAFKPWKQRFLSFFAKLCCEMFSNFINCQF